MGHEAVGTVTGVGSAVQKTSPPATRCDHRFAFGGIDKTYDTFGRAAEANAPKVALSH